MLKIRITGYLGVPVAQCLRHSFNCKTFAACQIIISNYLSYHLSRKNAKEKKKREIVI